jgi:RNA polymerase sigma factor (sigma-70 family)
LREHGLGGLFSVFHGVQFQAAKIISTSLSHLRLFNHWNDDMMTIKMTPVATSEDAELVNASLAGDREAFGQIVARYQSLVCSLAYSATGSLSQSEDLAQETFLTAWKQLVALREPPKLRAWLCGIARNLINNSLRKQGREPSHRAESLEGINETHSPEPQPAERAISKEEADILWRSLERIPETYREPLVLFYREHQSIEAVAQNLELTEETVRQRLSRGRKLLQEEILAFVEGALEKTAPGQAFTLSVVGALPLAATATKAAAAGIGVAKSGAGAKGLLSLGSLGGFVTMLGTIFYSWKALVDDSKSPRERQFTRRVATIQIAFSLVILVVGLLLAPFLFDRHPLVFGIAYAALILFFAVNVSVGTLYLVRRRLEIRMEDGTFFDTDGNTAKTRQKVFQRTNRISLIWLLIFALGCIGFPWKHYASRSLVCVAAGCLVFAWSFRRQQQFQESPAKVRLWISRFPVFARNPTAAALVTMIGVSLLCGIACFAFSFFLNPVPMRPGMFSHIGLGLGVGLLVAGFIVLLMLAGRKLGLGQSGIFASVLQRIVSLTPGIGALVDKNYGPLFDQLNLSPDQRSRMKGMILDKTMAGARLGISMVNQKPDATQRAALLEKMKTEMATHEAQLREFLGEAGFQTCREYEKTVPERMLVNQFAGKFSGTALAPSAGQQEELRNQMSVARARFSWSTPISRREQSGAEYISSLNQDTLKSFAEEEETFNRQILVEVEGILNSEQLTAFGQFLELQRLSQVNQMKMSARLFASEKQ